ncbi:MAG: hypothetical protein IJT38_00730 [Clostridia bacterium]|nr:hypothetical protein [Clostridia bacterium]
MKKHLKPDGSNLNYGFFGKFMPILRQIPCKYTKYSPRHFPCLDKNLHETNSEGL